MVVPRKLHSQRRGLFVADRVRVLRGRGRRLRSPDSRLPPDRGSGRTHALAHGLTSYDAAYLELGVRLGVPLATLDVSLAAAAETEGVPLFAWPPDDGRAVED